MKQVSTVFLRMVIWTIGLFVIALCIFALPSAIFDDNTGLYAPIAIGMYIAAIPFFYALYQTLGLLDNIDGNEAFSRRSIRNLKNIRSCAIAIALVFTIGSPYVKYVVDRDDGPGILLAAFIIIFASMAIATFAAVLQKLVQSAVEMKEEHDLTV